MEPTTDSTHTKHALVKPANTTSNETAPSVMEHVKAVHTVPSANEEMAGTFVEIDQDSIAYRLQPRGNSAAKLSLDTRSEIKCASADLGFMTKTVVETIVEKWLNKYANTLVWQTFSSVYSTFEDALQSK